MDDRMRPVRAGARRRPDQLVLYWQRADGTHRTVAHGERAAALFQKDSGVMGPVAGMTLVLGVRLDGGMIVPLIRRAAPIETAAVADPDDRPYDGPDGSCDRAVPA